MTDKEIVERAKEAEKRTGFGELVHSPVSKGVNSAYGVGFIEGMVEYRNSIQEEPYLNWKDMSLQEKKDLVAALSNDIQKEEPVSEELEKVVEEIVDPTVLNAYGVKEIANRLRRTMIESVSEDLNTVAKEYANNITDKIGYRLQLRRAVCFCANWQKEQLMAKAVDATIEEPELLLWRVLGELEGLFVVENNLHDGDGVKVIIIKED